MRLVLGGLVGALAFTLAACGSNGSPTPSPTPTPTPTPTGTPTPAPAPTDITFTTSEAGLQYTTENGIQLVANTAAVAPAMGTVFRFTPNQGGYTYVLQNGSVVPSASESIVFPVSSIKDCARATLCFGNGFVHQQVDAAASSYFLSRFIPGSTSGGLLLGYSTFGALEESVAGGGRRLVDLRPFAYGVATPATGTNAIPTTGTHTYNGLVIGQATGNKPAGLATASNIYQLTGTLQVVANHAAKTATIKLTLNATPTGCSPCAAAAPLTYDGTGTLAAGIASFTLPGGGTARFFMAGPLAAEIAGSFTLTATDPKEAAVTMTLAGSGAGKR
jgi:hypothetical protein